MQPNSLLIAYSICIDLFITRDTIACTARFEVTGDSSSQVSKIRLNSGTYKSVKVYKESIQVKISI